MKKNVLLFLLSFSAFEVQSQWTEIYQDSTLLEVADLHFFNKDTGVVCGMVAHGVGFVLRTEDGGVTWNNTISDLAFCTYIFFLNDTLGYTGGQDGIIYKTEDGGAIWNYCCNSGVPYDADGFYCFNDSTWLTNRYGGDVLKSINYGGNWIPAAQTITSNYGIAYFYERNINPFYFLTDSVGFVVGHGVYKTIDQGSTWQRMNADTMFYLRAITMKNSADGFAVGNGGVLLKTYDGGLNWNLDSISNQDLRDIKFINNMEGYCVGGGFDYFNDTTGIVIKTSDGGQSWTSTEISKSRLNSIQFIDSVGYAVGNFGNIFKMVLRPELPIDSTEGFPDQVIIYPSPFNNYISISLPKITGPIADVYIDIFDSSGRLCIKQKRNSQLNKFDINTISLTNGIYAIRINYGNTTIVKKLLKTWFEN